METGDFPVVRRVTFKVLLTIASAKNMLVKHEVKTLRRPALLERLVVRSIIEDSVGSCSPASGGGD